MTIRMVEVPTTADLATFVSNNQGQTINVPQAEYDLSGPLQVGAGTKIIFKGTRLVPQPGYQYVFRTSGSGWHVGGSCTIDQNQRGFYVNSLRGSGQLGDATGRIVWEGHASKSAIPLKAHSNSYMWLQFDSGGGKIKLVNLTFHGHPPGHVDDLYMTWTNRTGDIEMVGCDFRNFNHGWYLKAFRGKFIARDSYLKDLSMSAFRTGADGGTLIERCNVIGTDQRHGSHTAGKSGVTNHSCMTFQDTNGNTGPVVLRKVHYQRWGQGGAFLRRMPSGSTHVNLTIEDCQYTNLGTTANMAVDWRGTNGNNPQDFGKPYPFGGGESGPIEQPEPPSFSDFINLDGSNTLVIEGTGNPVSSYHFEVANGTITPGETADLSDNTDRLLNGDTRVEGTAGGQGTDDWSYTGRITSIAAPSLRVKINETDVTDRLQGLVDWYASQSPSDPSDPTDPTPPDEPTDPSDPSDPTEPAPSDSLDLAIPLIAYALLRRKR